MQTDEAPSGAPTILVLHPDPFVGMMMEELLIEAGVGKTLFVTTDEEAAASLAISKVDGAVLGINNHNSEILAIAARLTQAGIPFIVSGSLTKLPDAGGLDTAPLVSVLAGADELAAALASAGVNIASQGGGS